MTNKPTSSEGFWNILTVIDEYNRFPFAFATVLKPENCLMNSSQASTIKQNKTMAEQSMHQS